MTAFVVGVVVVLLLIVSFLSLVEAAVARLTRLALKVLAEKHTGPGYSLLRRVASDRTGFLLPLQVGSQSLLAVVAVLVTYLFLVSEWERPVLLALIAVVLIVILVRQLVPRLIVERDPQRVLLKLFPSMRGGYRVLGTISAPVVLVLAAFRARHKEAMTDEEAGDEEIQAYLGVGEEEGIFESTETPLIQSALEFGSTLVREIMTPRNEIVAIEQSSTLSQLREVVVNSKHSRIPVYRGQIDHVVGVVYVRALLAQLEAGSGDKSIEPLINEVVIVPETKKVSELLKDLQAGAERMAIVINEYGTVSGLVTVEDLLEEIVGDIRDEDELRRVDLVYQGGGHYLARGGLEVEDLEEELGVHFGEHQAATVSGLVVSHLGKVPSAGETLVLDGVLIEVLSSDQRRIHSLRVSLPTDSEPQIEPSD
jgi:CBS domain containing-hemolysin-like protein